jgi:hypothetical protein
MWQRFPNLIRTFKGRSAFTTYLFKACYTIALDARRKIYETRSKHTAKFLPYEESREDRNNPKQKEWKLVRDQPQETRKHAELEEDDVKRVQDLWKLVRKIHVKSGGEHAKLSDKLIGLFALGHTKKKLAGKFNLTISQIEEYQRTDSIELTLIANKKGFTCLEDLL